MLKHIIFSLFLLTTATLADDLWQVTPPPHMDQMQINQWGQQEYEKADAELNRVWEQLLSKVRKKEERALVDAQLHWLKFRDDQARAEALAYEGGSMSPFVHSQSLIISTRVRTKQLRLRLDELIRLGN